MENEQNSIEILGEVVEEKNIDENAVENNDEANKTSENTETVAENNNDTEIVDLPKENNNDTECHGINISEEVVATIAGIAASEVNGVASMNGGFVGGLSEMLGKKTKGVKVQVGEKETIIDINLTVEYGARIPDVAWEVQNKVKTQVESMTGLNVTAVNIHIQGVSLKNN